MAFIQNHDQIGNRAFGDRLSEIAPKPVLRALAAIYLLLPQVPMLFMGEEWATTRPFPFFCDFDGELAAAVSAGRRAEFAHFPQFQDEATRSRIPDPQALSTFASSKLDWESLATPPHAEWLDWYTHVLVVRREFVSPLHITGSGTYEVVGSGAVSIRWQGKDGDVLTLEANLSDTPVPCSLAPPGAVIWQEGTNIGSTELGAWTVRWTIARKP